MPQITLKAARVNSNLTQKTVAEELNVSVSTIKNWEKGVSYPKQPQICQLCELYGMSFDDIFFN